jgi:hypothetical protein
MAEGIKSFVGKDGNADSKHGSKVPEDAALVKPNATPTTGRVGTQKPATSSEVVSNIANRMSTVRNTAATDNNKGWFIFSCSLFSEISSITLLLLSVEFYFQNVSSIRQQTVMVADSK